LSEKEAARINVKDVAFGKRFFVQLHFARAQQKSYARADARLAVSDACKNAHRLRHEFDEEAVGIRAVGLTK